MNYNEFVNEEMSTVSTKKLRDAMHDVIVELGAKETLDVEEMSNILMADYKITISPFFLDKFLDDFMRVKRGDRKARTFFTRGDVRWLGVRDNKGTKEMRNNLLHQKPSLTKHKRRLFAEADKKKLEDAYNAGMKDLSFTEDIIKKTFVLQRPEDSKEIIKLIYSDVIIDKKYDNIYDNCWKLMLLIGKQNKMDRIRGYFQYAPQSVKDEYQKTGKWMYNLTKPSEKKPIAKKQEKPKKVEVSDQSGNDFVSSVSPITEENLNKIDEEMKQYRSWEDFIKSYNLFDITRLINRMKLEYTKTGMDEFLAKLDEFNMILNKFYMVDRIDMIEFYKKLGLAAFLREWQETGKKPVIKDF